MCRRGAVGAARALELESQVIDVSQQPTPNRLPYVPVPAKASSSWRENALTRAHEIEALSRTVGTDPGGRIQESLDRHLDIVREVAGQGNDWRHRWTWLKQAASGAELERANSRLAAAELDLLRMASEAYVRGSLPGLLRHARGHLERDDPRLLRLQELATTLADQSNHPHVSDYERELIMSVAAGASAAHAREVTRLRRFRNVLIWAVLSLFVITGALCITLSVNDDALPLCFTVPSENPTEPEPETEPEPAHVVCPTGESALPEGHDADRVIARTTSSSDVLLVAGLGAVAAALAAATSLRNLRTSHDPYALASALAILKLLSGALTAILGIVLMRGEFIPGLSALDTSGQILAWAVVFGYAQQLFTGVVDTKASNLVKGTETAPAPAP